MPSRLGLVDATTGHVTGRAGLGHNGPYGLATNAGEQVAYVERDARACSTGIGALTLRPNRTGFLRKVARIATVPGHWIDDVAAAPVLSPNGLRLAVLVDGPPLARDSAAGRRCEGPERLIVIDLVTRSERVFTGNGSKWLGVGDLEWAPDSRHLAVDLVASKRHARIDGTRLVDTAGYGSSYASAPRITRRGFVFWWKRQLVAARNGDLVSLRGADAGKVIARGLPRRVDAVSAAGNGDLLVRDAAGETWWWDGHLSRRVPDAGHRRWVEPVW